MTLPFLRLLLRSVGDDYAAGGLGLGTDTRWVHDPYFQHFTGEEFFQHEFPHERART